MSKLLWQRITSMREYKGLSQSELANLAGIGQAYMSKLERGIAPNAAGIILGKLATALETSVDYFLGLTDNPSPTPTANHPALHDPAFAELAASWARIPQPVRQNIYEYVEILLDLMDKKERGLPLE